MVVVSNLHDVISTFADIKKILITLFADLLGPSVRSTAPATTILADNGTSARIPQIY